MGNQLKGISIWPLTRARDNATGLPGPDGPWSHLRPLLLPLGKPASSPSLARVLAPRAPRYACVLFVDLCLGVLFPENPSSNSPKVL